MRFTVGYHDEMTDVTQILNAIEQGDPSASDKLLPLVYEELRVLARQRLANEKPGQTLQATALVHEAYLRLVGRNNDQNWNNRGHFFGAASEAMRRIIIENARRKKSKKRRGVVEHSELEAIAAPAVNETLDLLDLDEALTELEEKWPRQASVVKLRYFAGLTNLQVAEAIGISRATVERYWTFARTWLATQLQNDD